MCLFCWIQFHTWPVECESDNQRKSEKPRSTNFIYRFQVNGTRGTSLRVLATRAFPDQVGPSIRYRDRTETAAPVFDRCFSSSTLPFLFFVFRLMPNTVVEWPRRRVRTNSSFFAAQRWRRWRRHKRCVAETLFIRLDTRRVYIARPCLSTT